MSAWPWGKDDVAARQPVNVLHILEPSLEGQDSILGVVACVQNLAPRFRHLAILLGTRQDELTAQSLWLTLTDRVTTRGVPASLRTALAEWMPGGTSLREARATARIIRTRQAQVGGIDVVLCWSAARSRQVAQVVSEVCGPEVAVRTMLTSGPSAVSRESLWTETGTGAGRVRVTCFDEQIASAWRGAGAPLIDVLTPPVVSLEGGPAARARVRRELDIANDELVVGLLCDPPTFGDTRLFAWIMGVLAISGRTCVGIVPDGAGSMRRAARYLRLHRRHWDIMPFCGPTALAMSGADVVIWDTDPARAGTHVSQPASGQLSALSVGAMGIPIVTIASDLTRRTMTGAPGWCRVGNASMPSLGAGVLPLADDAMLREQVGKAIAQGTNATERNRSFALGLETLLRSDTMVDTRTRGGVWARPDELAQITRDEFAEASHEGSTR